MLPRLALVGLAVAVLSGPVCAAETPAADGAGQPGTGASAAAEPKRRLARRRRHPRHAARAAAAEPTADAAVGPTANAAAGLDARSEPDVAAAGAVVAAMPPLRPTFPWDAAPVPAADAAPASASIFPAPAPAPAASLFASLFGTSFAAPASSVAPPVAGRSQIDGLIALHARINGVPEELVRRIVVRESKYNPRAVGRGGAMGLMQIKTATARALGYSGTPAGLLDAETNLTYAVKYLAGAYRTAGGNHDLAVQHYARGYYYAAKRQGLIQTASAGSRRSRHLRQEADATPASEAAPAEPAAAPSLFSFLKPADAAAVR